MRKIAMKMKMLAAVSLFLCGVVNVSAQDNCNLNSSISHEAVKAKNYKDAYEPWKEVMKECPTLRFYTYTDGIIILTAFLNEDDEANNRARSSEQYKQYFDELMATHDQRIKYIPEFEKTVKGIPSIIEAQELKVLHYINYAPSLNVNQTYDWLSQIINERKDKSNPGVFHYFLDMSMNKLKQDQSFHGQFIQDYLTATKYVDEALQNAEAEDAKAQYQVIKDNLVAMFINSGAADCESLQTIYAPQIEENKTDLDFLKKVIEIMRSVGCTESEAYFQASIYSYQIQPTPEAAAGSAAMAAKKGDMDAAIKYLEEAIGLESDIDKKADYAYTIAVIQQSLKRYSASRASALKALSFKENYGKAYILIANLYAASTNWSDENALNKATYFLVIDKLNRAKAVDPSVAEEANKLIARYSPHTPAVSELFMLGHKAGDRITIGGWIGESTTIR